MRIWISAVLIAFLLYPLVADAGVEFHTNRRKSASTVGSSVGAGCSPWGSDSIEINGANDNVIITVSLWGQGYKGLKAGQRQFTTDMREDESSNGRGTVCDAGDKATNCRYESVQVNFTSTDPRPSGTIAGSVTFGSDSIKFSATNPSPANCPKSGQ